KSRKRRNIAGIARRRPGFVVALRPFARLTLYGLIALERGQTGECRLGVRAGRKLAQEIGEPIQRGGGAERDPGQLLESRAREPPGPRRGGGGGVGAATPALSRSP